MFSVDTWDGLAKIGKYSIENKDMITPALFPVVDPFKQEVPINELYSEFKFDQVITSAYLMSKRLKDQELKSFPNVHDYLNFKDGLVMMDSGAYQVMVYGDIDLGVEDTLALQNQVRPDIGVIMDHPIGFDVKHAEAQKRIKTTIENIEKSIPLLKKYDKINWTLPIQGGRFHDLMIEYLDYVTKPEIIDNFNFFALGSVVPIMINQRYDILVKMIKITRERLPVNKPLHLFGAGHPSMFALATYLGCDTFDSAAYILMAKDERYMTVDGTKLLKNLREFPCHCKICVAYTPKEIMQLKKEQKTKLLARHNLWTSIGEINSIRNAIREGNLWDLVQQRASAVPNLYRATRRAMEFLSEGKLGDMVLQGTEMNPMGHTRIIRPQDVDKPIIRKTQTKINHILSTIKTSKVNVVCDDLIKSVYNKRTIKLFNKSPSNATICFLLPPFGLVPLNLYDIFPIGQMTQELDLVEYKPHLLIEQVNQLKKNGVMNIEIYAKPKWQVFFKNVNIEGIIINYTENPIKSVLSNLKS